MEASESTSESKPTKFTRLSDEEFLVSILKVFSSSFDPDGLSGEEILVQLRDMKSLPEDYERAMLQLVPVMDKLEADGYIHADPGFMLTQSGVDYAKNLLAG
ncbi:MAG: hypothetical protein SGJ27_28415 [Candidatus Melainabacteria bacterium]|nr:hypothetical protein [Candidatus Melainabacteria bacterium]